MGHPVTQMNNSLSNIGAGAHSLDAPPSRRLVLPVLCLLTAMALLTMPFLTVAPNRLVSGEPVSLLATSYGLAWLLALPSALLALAAASKPGHGQRWAATAMAIALLVSLLWLAGAVSTQGAATASPLARTSLGGGFWAASLLLGLIAADAIQGLQLRRHVSAILLAAGLLPVLGLLASGWCDELSIMKEYANRSDAFWEAMARHLQIVLLALVPACCLGLPLGWLAQRRARVGALLFPVLNVLQTIPSIALFGLLMAPLALLAAALPALARAGISGVGLAPGVMALMLYSLLPVVRASLAGLRQVPASVRDAAWGLGMSPGQLFWHVDVPLAAPVVLAGLRAAAVQAVGLAAVTALIGAGGLGAIMFEGLFSSAQDLVILAVVPMVVLGVLTDAAFGLLISHVRQNEADQQADLVEARQAA